MIMTCVTFTTYSALLNGQPRSIFYPSHGLQQGDPIAPYLYLLCAKSLSTPFSDAKCARHIHGIKVSKGNAPIFHLFFADGSLIFYHATLDEWQQVKQVLHTYEQSLSQSINHHKSSIFFSSSTNKATRAQLVQEVGVTECSSLERYLGLPALMSHAKLSTFNSIKDKVWICVNNWKHMFLT